MNPRDKYLAAMDRFLTVHGVSAESRFIKLPWHGLNTHLLETGKGDLVVFVIGGGGTTVDWTPWLALDPPERVTRMVHIGCPAQLLDTGTPMPMPLLGVPVLGRIMMARVPPSLPQVKMVFDSMNEGAALEKDPALAEVVLSVS